MKKLLLIALSTVAISAHAWEPEVYVGGGGAAWQYQHASSPSNYTINTIEGVAGMKVLKYLAVEGRVGAGLNSGEDSLSFVDDTGAVASSYAGEAEVSFYAGLYLKPMISNEKATLYGIIGYTTLESEFYGSSTVAADVAYEDSEDEITLGAGASWVMSENVELTAEWRNLINNDVVKMSGGTVGFIYKF